MDQWIAQTKDSVRGKMVLIGKAAVIPVDFNPPQKRLPDDPAAALRIFAGIAGIGGRGQGQNDGRLTPRQVAQALDAMLLANGALVRIRDAALGQGIVVAQSNSNYAPEKTVPAAILRNDDYGRIERLLEDKDDVKLEFNIENKIFPEGKTSYNVVAEIPGSDKADEVVMLGGHLDSWHAATGATDNGIGSSIMLEAARIIQTLGLKPRRTVRVALWSGEEGGRLGSLAYVKAHFGTFENPRPEFAKLDCYFNLDLGTGRPRIATIFAPPEGAQILEPLFALFRDWGLGAVTAINSRVSEHTDSTSYNNAGLPGIDFLQDPIEYFGMTHHTNLDTYERIIPEDAKQASAEVAAAVWFVANRDQMMPRFTKETMPPPVPAR
jgi:Zn-dependent M28 family amino/carboxypeptidase